MPTLAELLADATVRQQVSKRGRDWMASIPDTVPPVGPTDSHPMGSSAQSYNQSYGDLIGSQILPPDSDLPTFVDTNGQPPTAEQQRQQMAQLEMQKELGRLLINRSSGAGLPPNPAADGTVLRRR